jgi:uncharacterized damage-inducible protein DinB
MTSPAQLQAALDANLAVIQQGIRVLDQLGVERYVAPVSVCYRSSIGGHLRHIIEHYRSFFAGLGEDGIDYEKRARDPEIEHTPSRAAAALLAIAGQLSEMSGRWVRSEAGYVSETAVGVVTPTSVLRELEFLLSHTVHHYALIAVMARLQGCEPEPSFGIAPSTLRYQATLPVACAQ